MINTKALAKALDQPKTSLAICWLVWKLILLCIAYLGPGYGYDTSTTLLHLDETLSVGDKSFQESWLRNLVRWDSIYFIEIARRGYAFEQEWAFGWGFTKVIAYISRCQSPVSERSSQN